MLGLLDEHVICVTQKNVKREDTMNLIFKNPTIKTDYEYFKKTLGLSIEETSRLWTKNKFSEERKVFSILIGYLDSICDIADRCENQYEPHPMLDLTYETVEHLPLVLGHQYFSYVESGLYTGEKALEIANKTLAAYLMLLCMNEHMCFPTVSRLNNFEDIRKSLGSDMHTTHKDSWMGCTIKVGVDKEMDLLTELGNVIRVSASGAFRVRISRLVELYKQMCGVDLREMGLDDFELRLSPEE